MLWTFENFHQVFTELGKNDQFNSIPHEVRQKVINEIYAELTWDLINETGQKYSPKKATRKRKANNSRGKAQLQKEIDTVKEQLESE